MGQVKLLRLLQIKASCEKNERDLMDISDSMSKTMLDAGKSARASTYHAYKKGIRSNSSSMISTIEDLVFDVTTDLEKDREVNDSINRKKSGLIINGD